MTLRSAPRRRSNPRHDGARIRATMASDPAPKGRPTLSRDGTPSIAERAPQSAPNLPQEVAQNSARHSSPARYSDRHSAPDTALGIPLDTPRKQRQMAVEAAVTTGQEINDVMDDHTKCPNRDLSEFRKLAIIIYHSEPPLAQVESSAQNGAWCRNRTDTRHNAGNAGRGNAKMARRVLGKRLN